jgi:hypothetical protein
MEILRNMSIMVELLIENMSRPHLMGSTFLEQLEVGILDPRAKGMATKRSNVLEF